MNIGAVTRLTCVSIALFAILAILPAASSKETPKGDKGHYNANCPSCHSFAKINSDSDNAKKNLSDNCSECHNPAEIKSSGYPLNFHNKAEGNCLNCHQFHQTDLVKAGARSFTLNFDSKSQLFQCFTCHNDSVGLGDLSSGHRLAAAVYHSNNPALTYLSPSEKCLICHSARSDLFPDLAEAGLNPPTFNEHASHPYGISAQTGGNKIDAEKVSLLDGRIECQSCHRFDTARNGEMTLSEYPGETCRTCHPR